ncbi:MAG TPA: tryptophan synthase subunit alpha [Ferruginibacter sp.]|jgi:tryptophan synthase alpha chain|nr:tryptophan synthase subunit alpha [Ferruginibacter sp.]
MRRIIDIFNQKRSSVLNIYCTAGYPQLGSTPEVIDSLQNNGADIIEIGIPYSDPIADGPVIQQSNMQALHNGMSIAVLFEQLKNMQQKITVPIILMGYLNPVLQYGIKRFCADAQSAGVAGIILPDLPIYEFETTYRQHFEKHELSFIFLVTPQTSAERIRRIDSLSSGFIYAVSSSSTTGNTKPIEEQAGYFKKLKEMKLKNPVMVGFGIKDKQSFNTACEHAEGAIIGSAYINAIKDTKDINGSTKEFLNALKD